MESTALALALGRQAGGSGGGGAKGTECITDALLAVATKSLHFRGFHYLSLPPICSFPPSVMPQ